MALHDGARCGIHRTAESKADTRHAVPCDQPVTGGADLLEDARGAAFGDHIEPFERDEFPVAHAHAELQLRAADFDAEKHGGSSD